MKRTNLVLDGDLLMEAVRLSDEKTFSGAVNAALREFIRIKKMQEIPRFFGTNIWEGDLPEMRGDADSVRR